MALHYRTEYRMGNRGRVCRSYTGFQAIVAIAFDLVFGLLFELVFASLALVIQIAVMALHLTIRMLRLYWRVMVAGITLLVYGLTLPFACIHRVVGRLRDRSPEGPAQDDPDPLRKPSWAFGREL